MTQEIIFFLKTAYKYDRDRNIKILLDIIKISKSKNTPQCDVHNYFSTD